MANAKRIVRVPAERERRSAERYTGRYLMTIEPGKHDQVAKDLSDIGMKAAQPVGPGTAQAKPLPRGHYLMFPNVGVAVVDPLTEHEDNLVQLASQHPAVSGLEPERVVFAFQEEIWQPYVRGWKDAITSLHDRLLPEPVESAAVIEEARFTRGLMATRVAGCRFSGSGIKIAVLDTGLDLNHPDFQGRKIVTQNFVGDNKPFHDGVGHGTHCTGTAAGPARPARMPRYGIAFNCDIFAGRVLDDDGFGGDANILQGIDWAISQGCQIISLSLGAHYRLGDPPFSQAYEMAAQRALAAGCLIVAAAGNDGNNPLFIGAVGTPGNSPSVLTVAAVDQSLATAPFSDRVSPLAPGVKGPDLAAPGVDVYSSWVGGTYRTISGTSMATPHVAGIAALFAEQNPTLRGQALKNALLDKCQALSGERMGEIGKGLVQAPTEPK